jgi:cellulose synthase/poly-beta-1,6-N-acetylglucosamine synthase-like glycosyltransferase
MFNELYVAERLLDSIARLDYPKDKLELQVLDDSTDETTEIVARKVAELKANGFDIVHLRREDRHGFKAGRWSTA